jgi:hypothetical protein
VGRRPYTEGLNLEAIGVEKDNKGRIVIDDQFNTSVKGVKCIGDVTFGPMLAHKAEEEGQPSLSFSPRDLPSLTLRTQVSPLSSTSNQVTATSTTPLSPPSCILTLKWHGLVAPSRI